MVRNCAKRSMFSSIKGDDKPEKEAMRLGLIVRVIEAKKAKESKKKLVKCFLCCKRHRLRDSPKRSKLYKINKGEKAELNESKASKLRLMVLIPAKRNNKQVGLMFMDINIVG